MYNSPLNNNNKLLYKSNVCGFLSINMLHLQCSGDDMGCPVICLANVAPHIIINTPNLLVLPIYK